MIKDTVIDFKISSIEAPFEDKSLAHDLVAPSPSKQILSTSTEEHSGNLLGSLEGWSIAEINGHPVSDLSTSEGIVTYHHPEGLGTLTIFSQAYQGHAAGDFYYRLDGHSIDDEEHFQYQLQNAEGTKAYFDICFDSSTSGIKTGEERYSSVYEEGLLPGGIQATQTFGVLDLHSNNENVNYRFEPLLEQKPLLNAELTSQGLPLHYTLNNDATILSAKQGIDGAHVFTAQVYKDGSFTFELGANLDRALASNLIQDPDFKTMNVQNEDNWISARHYNQTTLIQAIATEPGEVLQLTLNQHIPWSDGCQLEIFWNGHSVYRFSDPKTWTPISVTLEGGVEPFSELKITGTDLSHSIQKYLTDLVLLPIQTQSLALEFAYEMHQDHEIVGSSQFGVFVAAEHSLVIDQSANLFVIFDQMAYQNIIVQDSGRGLENGLTTLNLEQLFDQMRIAESNREVNIVQRDVEGLPSNVYEVRIQDKSSSDDAITVADIRLSVPNGDGGLDIFNRHIFILES